MTVTLAEAQARLADLIAQQIPGEEIRITLNGRTIARLTKEYAPPQEPRVPGSAKGMIVMYADDDEHLKDFADYM